MGGLFLAALLTLVLVRAVPAVLRALRGADRSGDLAARLLRLAVRGLPAERTAWGRAMLAELDAAPGARARWRFSLGCLHAVAALRMRSTVGAPDRGGTGIRALVLGTATAAVALAAYGLVRYPGLRDGTGAWLALVVLALLLCGYTLCALGLSRGTSPRAVSARRHGLAGGLAIGAAWLVVLGPTPLLRAWVFAPLMIALLAPASVAFLCARDGGDATAATAAALWSGLVGGLLAFDVWVTATYLRDGRPYDPQLLRDFQRSGAHDLATYAISDNLGAALGLLVIVPTVAVALGSLGGSVAAGRHRPR